MSVFDIPEAPVNHSKPVKVLIFGVSHLAQTKVFAIWINCLNSPIRFFCDQHIETLELFVIHNS
jgi:hypothetical protein